MNKKEKDREIPCFHLFIYRCMKEKCHCNFITYSDIKKILRRRFHEIPRILHYRLLKEMEDYGLIKRIGNKKTLKYELVGNNYYELLDCLDGLLGKTKFELTGKDKDRLINQYNPLF